MKVVGVWSGVYVGSDEYEGGSWGYQTTDGKYHNIEYTVNSSGLDELLNGLVSEIKKLKRRKDITPESKESDLDLTWMDCTEKWIFSFDDGSYREFEV